VSVLPAVVAVLLLCLVSVAAAEELHDAASIERVCKAERDSSLCKEVRRLCAAREVLPAMVPACKALGVWGDTPLVEVHELCTLEPDHPRCTEIKAACAADGGKGLGQDGPAACAAAGWGPEPRADNQGPAAESPASEQVSPEQAEQVINYCRQNAADQRCLELRGACAQLAPSADPMVTRVCQSLGLPMSGHAGAPSLGGPPLKTVQALISRQQRAFATGFMGVGLELGDDEALGGARWALAMAAETVSFGPPHMPVGFTMQLHLGGTEDGGFLYRFDTLVGLAYLGQHFGFSLNGGAGTSGIARDRLPMVLELPLRTSAQLIVSARLTVLGWAQVDWLFGSEARQDGSISFPFADAAQAGLCLFIDLGWRPPGQTPPRLVLGAIGFEALGGRAIMLTLGLGTAQEPMAEDPSGVR
jgi:hypothetical protein